MGKNRKYIFITGGVVSSLGKGLTLASIALLLEKRGYRTAPLKLDPYFNVDPGTMNPCEHGEVYVTDDGIETDLDLGHYYRYTSSLLSRNSIATSGHIYGTVIENERRGHYLGQTVQVIPHITDEIQNRILKCGENVDADIVLVEIGGTVGDIESLPFLEAIRQFRYARPHDCLNLHMTYVPYLKAAGEVKTKPTQHSVQTLRGIGILPDLILCRSESRLSTEIKKKISLFCSVPPGGVFEQIDVATSIYEVPLMLEAQGVGREICMQLSLQDRPVNLHEWETLVHTIQHSKKQVRVGVVGKYLQHRDAYKSLFEALQHGALAHQCQLHIETIESDKLDSFAHLECDGFLVPGGFGQRGWEGKIDTARFCREQKIPYFGICLGMQALVVEFARHVLGLKEADSTEMQPQTKEPVVSLLSEQQHVTHIGGTMRLGAYSCLLREGSRAHLAYGAHRISERHRHRYEFNNLYKERAEKAGLIFSGILEEGSLCEIVELKDHPCMLGVQFHPEFKSRPTDPHPLFKYFIEAMLKGREERAHR